MQCDGGPCWVIATGPVAGLIFWAIFLAVLGLIIGMIRSGR